MNGIPWILVAIIVGLVVLGVGMIVVFRKRKDTGIRRQSYAVLALGISICLVGAFLMVVGESIVGPDHTGIATIVGIVGIGIIASSAILLARDLSMKSNH